MLGKLLTRSSPVAPFLGSSDTSLMPGYAGWGAPVGGTIDRPAMSQALTGTPGTTNSGLPPPSPYGRTSIATEGTVLSLAAAWRCAHILTNGIASLDMYAFDDNAEDRRVSTPRLLSDPWPAVSPVEWRAMVVASLIFYGNCYVLPFDEDPRTGYPRQLPIVHPERVDVKLRNGVPIYYIDESQTDPVDVLHIRGYTPPGAAVGIGIVEAHRRGISLALDMDRYQQGNFQQSSVPPVVIRVNRPEISESQATDIQMRWMSRHGFGNRAPAIIPTSFEVDTIAWSPEDTQFLQSKQYSAVEVCWMFGVDPRLLGLAASGQSLTYQNIETAYVDLQRMSFMPWTSRIESTLSRVLPRGVLARFDFSPILRTTLKDRYDAYAIALTHKFLTLDEVRQAENLGPIGTPIPPEAPMLQSTKAVNATLPTDSTALEVVA